LSGRKSCFAREAKRRTGKQGNPYRKGGGNFLAKPYHFIAKSAKDDGTWNVERGLNSSYEVRGE